MPLEKEVEEIKTKILSIEEMIQALNKRLDSAAHLPAIEFLHGKWGFAKGGICGGLNFLLTSGTCVELVVPEGAFGALR